MPKGDFTEVLIPIGPLAHGEIAAAALLALTTNDREWDYYAIALLQLLVVLADCDDLSHELVTHDVACFHSGDKAIEEMQVRPANGAAGYFNDSVAPLLDFGIGDRIASNVMLPVVTERLHVGYFVSAALAGIAVH